MSKEDPFWNREQYHLRWPGACAQTAFWLIAGVTIVLVAAIRQGLFG